MEQIDAEQVMAYVKDLGRILEVGTAEEREDVAHFESVGGPKVTKCKTFKATFILAA